MVKKIVLFFLYSFVFLALVIFFSPKENIYYLVQKELKKYSIVIESKDIKDTGFGLKLENVKIYFEGIEAAKTLELDIDLFFVLNSLKAQMIRVSSVASSYIPTKVDTLSATYTIFKPFEIKITSNGEFGEVEGEVNLTEKKLVLNLKASKKMKQDYRKILYKLKKQKDGGYKYEQKF